MGTRPRSRSRPRSHSRSRTHHLPSPLRIIGALSARTSGASSSSPHTPYPPRPIPRRSSCALRPRPNPRPRQSCTLHAVHITRAIPEQLIVRLLTARPRPCCTQHPRLVIPRTSRCRGAHCRPRSTHHPQPRRRALESAHLPRHTHRPRFRSLILPVA
ncbi:hypothetical protein B0H16DRAFT_650202 [Mycena metata]|uniref:Uncharacterized protein n=1 Tax=Mycena metata TaxID=1033252 RepID=A0AAD7J6Q9_9AGAR|nr:hypothetical protein B0H16DRAFT_650202 [Mycena metata]